MVTYSAGSGIEQATVILPMRNKDGDVGLHARLSPGTFVTISAQNQGALGTVTCKIVSNGTVISDHESSGAYAIVSCDAVV